MQLEVKKYLFDIRQAALRIQEFTSDKSFDDYTGDALLRSGVERQFEIVGEALSQLSKVAPDTAELFSDRRRIIAFRNILIHAYAEVDDRVVWDVVQSYLPGLIQEVDSLLAESEGGG